MRMCPSCLVYVVQLQTKFVQNCLMKRECRRFGQEKFRFITRSKSEGDNELNKENIFDKSEDRATSKKFGLTLKQAKEVDQLVRSYILQGECNEADVSKAIATIVQEYPVSLSAEKIDQSCTEVAKHYTEKDEDWLWGENLFCIVAYVYTVLCLLIDAVEVVDGLNFVPDNPSIEVNTIVFLQFLATLITVGIGNKFVEKHHGDRKYNVWFAIANKNMPTITMVTYLIYYTVKLAFAQGESKYGMVLFWVPTVYVIISLGMALSTYHRYRKVMVLFGEKQTKNKLKERFVRYKVPVLVVVGIFFVVGVPIIIHTVFKAQAPAAWFIADWTSGDVLGYYGGLLGVSGAAVGIWATIRHEQKKYREDVIRQSLPYFIMTTLGTIAKFDPLSTVSNIEKIELFPKNHYEEYPLDKIYYVIKNGSIKAKSKLSKAEREFIEHGGIKWERNGSMLLTVANKYISMPFEIENAGNGVSAFTKIGLNLRNTDKKDYINAIPLRVGQKIYIHILCEDVQPCDKGIYDFEIYYYDIFMNSYLQRYMISIQDAGKDVSISIETYSKQEKSDFPDGPDNE